MTKEWIIGLIVGFVLLSVGFYFLTTIIASHQIYVKTLKRKNKDQWGRKVSIPTPETLEMDRLGTQWQKEHDAYKRDVHIVNNGLNLYGEYYDIGASRAVIFLSGRTESLRYGYYFAKPYTDNGWNVLVIDARAHGYSDGEFNTLGNEESKDDLAWARFLNREFGVETIVFHGVCIGAAGGILAITSEDCPPCVKGLITEGMFPNFRESMRNNLIERKRLMFPVLQCIDFWAVRYTGHSMKKGPLDVISKMDKPILMLQSKLDKFSKVENAHKMFNLCPSTEKKLALFERGKHSMLRLTFTEEYDAEITQFLHRLTEAKEGVV